MTNVTPIRDDKQEKLMRPQEFADHLGQMLGVPAPSKRWLSDRVRDGMPSRLVLKRYRMIRVEAATGWLTEKGYL
jgi:hypothetical protein